MNIKVSDGIIMFLQDNGALDQTAFWIHFWLLLIQNMLFTQWQIQIDAKYVYLKT